jgi:hypothetical protein
VDRAVSPVHGSTVDQAKGYPPDLIRTVRGRSHDPGREHATRGGGHTGTESGRRRATALRRREPGKGFPTAKTSASEHYTWRGSTRTCLGGQGAACASTTADTERGRRGARRRAGTGAAACTQGKNDWEDDAHHVKKSRACLQAKKRRWRRKPTSAASSGGAPTAEGQGAALSGDKERSQTQGRHG